MDAGQDSKLKWEPADELADHESDWESDDEVKSTDHSDDEMDEDLMSSDGDDASTDGGTSSCDIPNKKARMDMDNSSRIEEDIVNSSCIKEDIVNSSRIEEDIVNSSCIEEDIVNSSRIEEDIVNSSRIEEDIVNSSCIEEDIVNSSRIEEDIVNSSCIEEDCIQEDMVTDGGSSDSEPTNKKLKKDTMETVINHDGDASTDHGTNKSVSSKTKPRRTKKTKITQEAERSDDSDVSIGRLRISTRTRKNRSTTNNNRPTTSTKKAPKTKKTTVTELGPREIVGDHWSPQETALLLACIKQYGMLNVEYLASILETKNVRQIKDFIIRVSKSVYLENRNAAKRRATRRLAKQNEGKPRSSVTRSKAQENKARAYRKLLSQEMGEGPIEWWLRHMEDTLTEMSKQVKRRDKANNPRIISDLIPRALLLISQYEDHPHPRLCGGVDYKAAYECLYHVLSGVPPKALSPPTAMFIQRSIDRLRNSILDGMYSPEYCKVFGEQVSHIQTTSKQTRLPPQRTYGAPSKKAGPVMTQGCGLPTTSQSLTRLMDTFGFNPMKVPESLTWLKGHTPPAMNKPAVKQKRIIRKDIPFGVFCDMDIYEGVGPSRVTK